MPQLILIMGEVLERHALRQKTILKALLAVHKPGTIRKRQNQRLIRLSRHNFRRKPFRANVMTTVMPTRNVPLDKFQNGKSQL